MLPVGKEQKSDVRSLGRFMIFSVEGQHPCQAAHTHRVLFLPGSTSCVRIHETMASEARARLLLASAVSWRRRPDGRAKMKTEAMELN